MNETTYCLRQVSKSHSYDDVNPTTADLAGVTVCLHGTLRKWSILDLTIPNERFLHTRKIPPRILVI